MVRSILIGAVAALVAVIPAASWRLLPQVPWFHPAAAFAAVAVAVLFAAPWASGARYLGLPNLIQHAHLPPEGASAGRWPRRALVTWLLTMAGLPVGPEGAAAEAAQSLANGTRPRSSRWFEQYRRTDAATSLASAVSAAFGAPFAGILLPLELGIGGRVISSVAGALTAFAVSDFARGLAGVPAARGGYASLTMMSGEFLLRAAIPVLMTVAIATAVALGLMVFASQARAALQGFAGRNARLSAAIGGAVALAVLLAYPPAQQPMSLTFSRIFTAKQPMLPVSLLLLSLFLGWVALRSSIGSLGGFWPLMAIGGACGAIAADLLEVSRALPVLAGAAAVWGAVLGAPLAAGVLAYELSGE
ncbi:MAG TPA: chloride channel protein, partial [Nannocystis sp.]